jgi:transposase-like protein
VLVKEFVAMAQSALSALHLQDEAAAFAYVEAKLWPDGPICPHCGETERVARLNGTATRLGLHKCYACKKQFTVRMGTIFESSHLPLHLWLQVIHLMCASKKGIATRQIQRMLNCSMKTAWFLGHRIREAMAEKHNIFISPLGGAAQIIEADEAYIGRDANKKLAGPGPQNPVFALVERQGRVRSFHVPNVTAANLHPLIGKHAASDSRFMTDESSVYMGVGWNFASHETVVHSRKEYVRGLVHTNTVEGYFSILKRGIYGIYQHVSEAHLKRYLSEFDFRYNTRMKLGFDDVARADLALKGAKGKRLTYQTTCRGRTAQAGGATA